MLFWSRFLSCFDLSSAKVMLDEIKNTNMQLNDPEHWAKLKSVHLFDLFFLVSEKSGWSYYHKQNKKKKFVQHISLNTGVIWCFHTFFIDRIQELISHKTEELIKLIEFWYRYLFSKVV